MPRRNSAKTSTALNESIGEQEEPAGPSSTAQHDGDTKQNVRSLEALFQAATSELQHMGKQGDAGADIVQGEGVTESGSESTQMVEVDSSTGTIRIQSADGSVHEIQHATVSSASTPAVAAVTNSPALMSASISPNTPPQSVGGRKRKHPQKPGKYVCSYCGRGCAKPSVLEKHLRAHTGERPYPCGPCGFAFKTKSNLYKHCKSRQHHLRVAGMAPEMIEGIEDESDNEDIEQSVVELVVPETQIIEKDKKKEMKYYIVEVKEGDSLEEVVKKARLAAGSEKIESITHRKEFEGKIENDTDAMVIQPEIVQNIPETGKYEGEWTSVEEVQVDPAPVTADEVTIVGHSTERVSDNTVKLEFQLAPSSASSEVLGPVTVSQQSLSPKPTTQPTVVTLNPSPAPQETLAKEVQNLPLSIAQVSHPSVHLQSKSLNPKLSSVALGAQRVTLPKPPTPQTPKTPGVNLTPEMLTARISELITKNQAIVNTPMADAPRPKRMSRQASENLTRSSSLSAASIPPTPASAPVQSRTNSGRQLFIQGADGKMTPLLLQDDFLNVVDTGNPSTPGVLTVTSDPQLTHQISLPVTPTLATPITPSGDNVIRQLLLKAPPLNQATPISQAPPPDPGSEAGVKYLCTPCALLFPSQEALVMHTKYQCPSSKQTTIDQNEAVLAQIGQQLEAQARNSPLIIPVQEPQKLQENLRSSTGSGTPLLLDIVDPEQPPKRGRPKGVKSRAHSETVNLAPKNPPGEMSNMMGRINLNVERQDSGGKTPKSRPNLKLTMPPQQQASNVVPIAPQTAPVKASNTPLPDWKARLKDKLLKRSMSVEKLTGEKSDNPPSGSQTAQVVITGDRVTAPVIISRPPLKRQASVGEESEPKRTKINADAEVVVRTETPEELVIESVDNAAQNKEENIDITLDEESNMMKVVNLDSGKSVTVQFKGLSENVLANILQVNDIEISTAQYPPNNAVWDKLTYCKGAVAPLAKTRPKKLPVLKLSSIAAQKIPGLLPSPVKSSQTTTSATETQPEAKSSATPVIPLSGVGLATLCSSATPVSSPAVSSSSESYPIPTDLHEKAGVVYLLLGHSYPLLVSDTATTFCSLLKPQPMYVELANKKVSMYSNWRTAPPSKLPLDLEIRELLGLQQTRRKVMEDSITVSAGREQPHHLTDSSYWKDRHGDLPEKSQEETTVEEMNTEEQEVIVIDSELLEQAQKVEAPVKPAVSMSNVLRTSQEALPPQQEQFTIQEVVVTPDSKETSKVRVCKGGYRTDEDYVYVRGRGRGRYVCEECGIRCKKPSMLRKHIHTHTDMRPFTCRYCRFSFKTKGNLTKHMKSKAHYKRCTELGIIPVPTTVEDPSTDTQAMHRLQQEQLKHGGSFDIIVAADEEDEKFWMRQEQQFAEMDAADTAEREEEDEGEEEEEEEEEVVEEMVIDDEEMQLVDVVPNTQKQQQQQATSTMVKAVSSAKSSDPFYIAVQTSTGEQPVFVKIAPKPQRLLEGEVAASLLDLSQTTSGSGGKGSNSQKHLSPTTGASGDDSNKNDHRLSSLVSALKSRTTDNQPSTQLHDGRLEQQKVVHLMRLATDSTGTTSSSQSKTTTPHGSTGFVPPVLQSSLTPATRITEPATVTETCILAPTTQVFTGMDVAVKQETASPKKPVHVDVPVAVVKQEGNATETTGPLLVVNLPEKQGEMSMSSDQLVRTASYSTPSLSILQKPPLSQVKQPLLTVDLPLTTAESQSLLSVDDLSNQLHVVEEPMEESQDADDSSLYIKQEPENEPLLISNDPAGVDPIATSVDPMLAGVVEGRVKKTSGPVVINLPPSAFSSLASSTVNSTFSSSSVTSSTTSTSPQTSTSTSVTSSPSSDQGPVQVITLPNGQTLSIPVSVLSLHGSPAVVPSQIPLGVRMVTTASTTQQNQTVVRIISPSTTTATNAATVTARSRPVEIQPIPGKVAPNVEGVNGKFQCDICDKEFPRQTQLAAHKNIHFFERPFQCKPCGVAYKTRGILEKHQRTETHLAKVELRKEYPLPGVAATEEGDGETAEDDPRPYKCDVCGIAFRVHGHLAKHLRSRMHVTRLEDTHALPAGTYDALERLDPSGAGSSSGSSSLMQRAIVATDPESARRSILALLAKKLHVDRVDPLSTISFDKSGKAVLVQSKERKLAAENTGATQSSATSSSSISATGVTTVNIAPAPAASTNLAHPGVAQTSSQASNPVRVILNAPRTENLAPASSLTAAGLVQASVNSPTVNPVKVLLSSPASFKLPTTSLVQAASSASLVQVSNSPMVALSSPTVVTLSSPATNILQTSGTLPTASLVQLSQAPSTPVPLTVNLTAPVMLQQKVPVEGSSTPSIFMCSVCNKAFNSVQETITHLQSHNENDVAGT